MLMKGARPPVALRGKPWVVHLVLPVKTFQETLVDGVQVDDEQVIQLPTSALARRLRSRS